MNPRVTDSQLEVLAKDVAQEPAIAALFSYDVVAAAILDLQDARARIAELEQLSASQEEAMQTFERGQL